MSSMPSLDSFGVIGRSGSGLGIIVPLPPKNNK